MSVYTVRQVLRVVLSNSVSLYQIPFARVLVIIYCILQTSSFILSIPLLASMHERMASTCRRTFLVPQMILCSIYDLFLMPIISPWRSQIASLINRIFSINFVKVVLAQDKMGFVHRLNFVLICYCLYVCGMPRVHPIGPIIFAYDK